LSLNCIGLHHLMSKPPAITTLPFLILQVGQPWGKHNLNGQKRHF
jgi:hypothetical protein